MEQTRIEILKDGVWVKVRLKDSESVKYNARINEIAGTDTRQLSATNTFSLPPTWDNLQALGINVFNSLAMAKALNRKYDAKYYIDDILIQSGYLLINNTNGGSIQVNFIDKSLDIVQKWGSITYKDLLLNTSLSISSDYAQAITNLRNYSLPTNSVLSPLGPVGSRGYNLCLFPNSLNTIGDLFQINDAGIRIDDAFNPYQSRPIFNVKSLYDLACERWGYTAIYDDSVDWENTVEKTYMVAEDQTKNEEGESGQVSIEHPVVSSNSWYDREPQGFRLRMRYLLIYPTSVSVKPNDVVNWVTDPFITNNQTNTNYLSQNSIFVPNVENGNAGTLRFRASMEVVDAFHQEAVIVYWNDDGAGDVHSLVYKNGDGNTWPAEITSGTEFDVDILIDKTLFNTVPVGSGTLLGVQVIYQQKDVHVSDSNSNILNMIVDESYLQAGAITFDTYGQYETNLVDFTYAAPTQTLKELLIASMNKEGILMNINADDKTIKFFSYSHYATQRSTGNYNSWDTYLQRYSEYLWKTDYGNNYAKINQIGLKSPFTGNTFNFELENQGVNSRYQDFKTNLNPTFKDVEQVFYVNNTLVPYYEYTNKGLGLVEFYESQPGTLSQQRADGNIQGNTTGLAMMTNVNYGDLPSGINTWYRLVDNAIRVEAYFLLPLEIIKGLDLSEPVYIGELGGFYIIEEVSEYENSSQPVKVKLIKLINDIEGGDGDIPITPYIALASIPSGDGTGLDPFIITTSTSFYNYVPVSATVTAIQFSGNPATIGVPTGITFQQVVSMDPYINVANIFEEDVTIGDRGGWYQFVVEDSNSLTSNTTTSYLGDQELSGPYVTIEQSEDGTGEGYSNVIYGYFNHVDPVNYAKFTYQPWNPILEEPTGALLLIEFPSLPFIGTVLVNFGAPGYYRVRYGTTEANTDFQIWVVT